ncbi:MAG: hypothetical protein RMN25_07430 [Anaerolineae bacterium]|nr:hypothetical protein [Thermoflexales bacterium]MDW8407601.1 hypothetical protein [Anaerolineae bacterium]
MIDQALGNRPASQPTPDIIVTYVNLPQPDAPTSAALAPLTPEAVSAGATPTAPATATPTSSACPAPADPTPPTRPDRFADIASALIPYLSAGATPTAVHDLLMAWGVILSTPDSSTTLGGVYQGRFLRADEPGTVIAIFDPSAQTSSLRAGDVAVYVCTERAMQLAYQALADPQFGGAVGYPRVLSTADVTGDGLDEVSFISGECGVSTCFDIAIILSFGDGHLRNIISDLSPHPFPAFTFAQAETGQAQDLWVQVGQYGSLAAGPQRGAREKWSWNGSVFTLTETILDEPVYRLHALHDADTALRSGDFTTAGALYRRVAGDPQLRAWEGPAPLRDEAEILGAFALYRLVELAARKQDAAGLSEAYEALQRATPKGSPSELYGALGNVFYSAYQASGSYAQACNAAIQFAEKNPNVYILLGSQTFGYANYDYLPADMCAR